MPRREQGDVDGGELLGILVTHDDAGGQSNQIVRTSPGRPTRGSTFGHMALAEGERQEGDVPVGAVGQAATRCSWALRANGQR